MKTIHILLTILVAGCQAALAQENPLPSEKTLRLDPDNQTSVPASLVLERVNYIPLETTRESLFGTISQLLITDDFFIIRDRDTKCVLFFYKNGKYHTKIRQQNAAAVRLSEDRSKIQFQEGGELATYDFDGKKHGMKAPGLYSTFHNFNSKEAVHFQYSVNSNNKDTVLHELWITKEARTVAEFLPYNTKSAPMASGDYFMAGSRIFYETGTDSSVLYCRPYDYSIYRITPAGITRPISFIFPLKNSLPDHFRTDTALSNKRIEYVNQHKDLVWGISHPYQIGNSLFYKSNRINGPGDAFLVNLNTGNQISLKFIEPDELTFQLPITDMQFGVEFMNKNFLGTDGQYVYSSLSSALLFKLKDEMADKPYEKSKVMKTYFAKGDRMNNPVLVQIMPKDNF